MWFRGSSCGFYLRGMVIVVVVAAFLVVVHGVIET